jgi:hypothetical protein
MAEGDGAIYNKFKERVLLGEIDLVDDTIKVGLIATGSPDIDAHEDWADISGNEESGTGYSAGGETLGSASVSFDSGTDTATFDGADVTWTGLDVGTPAYAVMYSDTHASDALIAYWTLGTTASNGGDYTLQWNSDGIITLT